jgi:hypothetical protein
MDNDPTRKESERDAESKGEPSLNLEESDWSDENRSPSSSAQEEMEERKR